MQNSDFWTRMYKSLWVPDLTCRFCAWKTAWLAPELLVYNGFQPPSVVLCHSKQSALWNQTNKSLWVPDITCHFVHEIRAWLSTRIYLSLWVPALIGGFVHAKSAWFAPEWQVYMGSSSDNSGPFVLEKQRDFRASTYKSVWVPDLICGFWTCT